MRPFAISTFTGLVIAISMMTLAPVSSLAVESQNDMREDQIRITVGAKTFTATLAKNATASALKARLPLTLQMRDLHHNEKFSALASPLPSDDANPGTIEAGDLMLWSSKSVVLFYKSFATNYSYTRLGRIKDPGGLADAVGKGEVTIKLEVD